MQRDDTISYWKKQAESLDLEWAEVARIYRWLRRQQREELAPLIDLRKAIWSQFPGTAKLTYKYAFTEGDRTMIPRWDEVATAICLEFHLDRPDASEYLWEIACKNKTQPPTVDETYAQAVELCLQAQTEFNPDSYTDTEF